MSEYIERGALLALLEERRDFLFKENGDYDHYSNGFDEAVDKVENFPVAADVVAFPCKVGETVYMEIGDDETPHFVDTGKVFALGIDESGTMWISARYECGLKYYHTSDDIGKTVFLTSEEAERALSRAKIDGE